MMTAPDDPATFRRYLLGEATEAETEAIERSFLVRDDLLEAIRAAEQDLIDAYLDGTLDPEATRRFETHYLASPVHRRRVTIARALSGRALPVRRRVPILPLAAIAAILVIAVLGAWLMRPRQSSGRLVAITLPAVLVRSGGETPTVRIGEGLAGVELRLDRGDWRTAPPYRVTVTTMEGEETWRGAAVVTPPAGDSDAREIVSVTIPAPRLHAGDYVVVLSTDDAEGRELQRYYFRVVRH